MSFCRQRSRTSARDANFTVEKSALTVASSSPRLNSPTAREPSSGSLHQTWQRLWVTPKTIKFHLSNVFRKLDVANRTEATHQAQLLGLLQAGGRGAAD